MQVKKAEMQKKKAENERSISKFMQKKDEKFQFGNSYKMHMYLDFFRIFLHFKLNNTKKTKMQKKQTYYNFDESSWLAILSARLFRYICFSLYFNLIFSKF